ncbi:MAG: DUF4249 domain-containing protein [Bacteroidales bacterium]
MNILFNRQLSVLVLNLLLFTGCRELVKSEFPDFEQSPVVNSIMVAGRPLQVHVSLAGKMDTFELQGIDNAEVLLYADGLFLGSLNYDGDGFYSSDYILRPSENYECRVTVPGYNEIVCRNLIPQPAGITYIEHIEKAGKDEEGMTYPALKFTFMNNPLEKQYFQAAIRLIYGDYESSGQILNITDTVLLNEGLPITLFSNQLIKQDAYTMTINYTTGSASGRYGVLQTHLYPLILELRSVSYDYYQYVKQLYLYEKGRYPDGLAFGAFTSFPLYSNIEGGYGIFAGYSSILSDTIYPSQYVKY